MISEIEKIPFGQGFLKAEKRNQKEKKVVTKYEIDPYALYVGNLPLNVTKACVLRYFNNSARIDIGHPQQLKNTRYAFVRFRNADDAFEAYKKNVNGVIESRSIIVRFRRVSPTLEAHQEEKSHPEQSVSEISTGTSSSVTRESDRLNNSTQSSLDLSIVKEEPLDSEEQDERDIKPSSLELSRAGNVPFRNMPTGPLIPTSQIKKEERTEHLNEDEMEEEEEDYDITNDNFVCKTEGKFNSR